MSNKKNEMVKVLEDNGYICKEISFNEMAKLIEVYPDCAAVGGDSHSTIFCVDTLDDQFRPLCLFTVMRCD